MCSSRRINIGLVSALLLGVTFESAISPMKSEDADHTAAESIVAIFMGMSLVFSLTVVVVSVIYIIEIDNAVTGEIAAAPGQMLLCDAAFLSGTVEHKLIGLQSIPVTILGAWMSMNKFCSIFDIQWLHLCRCCWDDAPVSIPNTLPTERDLHDFIAANAAMVDILTGVFCMSVSFIMVAAFAAM